MSNYLALGEKSGKDGLTKVSIYEIKIPVPKQDNNIFETLRIPM